MTIESPLLTGDARRWAVQALELEYRSSEISSSDLLRFVTQEDYVVSADLINAVKIVSNPSHGSEAANLRGRELRLASSIAEFTSVYFDLGPAQRSERWRQLSHECTDTLVLRQWLDQLALGLEIAELPTGLNERSNELLKKACEIFVLKPFQATRRRQEFVDACRSQPGIWENVARSFARAHPSFVDQIAPWIDQIPVSGLPNKRSISRTSALKRIEKSVSETVQVESTDSRQWLWISVCVIGLLRFLVAMSRFESQPDLNRPNPRPSFPGPNERNVQQPITPIPQSVIHGPNVPDMRPVLPNPRPPTPIPKLSDLSRPNRPIPRPTLPEPNGPNVPRSVPPRNP